VVGMKLILIGSGQFCVLVLSVWGEGSSLLCLYVFHFDVFYLTETSYFGLVECFSFSYLGFVVVRSLGESLFASREVLVSVRALRAMLNGPFSCKGDRYHSTMLASWRRACHCLVGVVWFWLRGVRHTLLPSSLAYSVQSSPIVATRVGGHRQVVFHRTSGPRARTVEPPTHYCPAGVGPNTHVRHPVSQTI
jgi:hypothetical protein